MKRDFTQATYQAFCDMVREIERAKLCDVTDWIGDRYYDVKHFFGDIGLYDKMSNQDKYRREMMDKENTSVEKIREIFEKVSSTDTGFAAGGGMCLKTDQELFSAYRKALRELSDHAVQAKEFFADGRDFSQSIDKMRLLFSLSFTGVDLKRKLREITFTSANFSTFSAEFKAQYVADFEAANPGFLEKIQKVLSDSDITDTERLDIEFLICVAPEPYRTLYLQHLSKYKVNVRDQDGAYYQTFLNTIYIDRDDGNFAEDSCGPYTTFFHESGHAIDDYEDTFGSLTADYKYNGRSLHDIVVSDVRNNVNQYLDENCPELTAEQRAQLLASLNLSDDASYSYGGSTDNMDAVMRAYRNKVVNHFHSDLAGPDNASASDVYGGVTNNAISGSYGHWPDSDSDSSKYDYWYNGKKATGAQESELWAEFFAAKMTNNEEALASIRAHFPQAYNALEAMARTMAGN